MTPHDTPTTGSAQPLADGHLRVEAVGTRPWGGRALKKALDILRPGRALTSMTAGAALGLAVMSGPLSHDIEGWQLSQQYDGSNTARIEATTADIRWVDLPQSPFIAAGWTEHGEFSNAYMMERWWAAGVPSSDFNELIMLGRASAPTIMGTRDAAMEAVLAGNARRTNQEMAARWPEAAKRLADPQWLVAHTYVETDDATAQIIDELEMAIIEEAAIDAVNGNEDYIEVETRAEAQAWVERAMEETGLRSLRLSSPWARDPQVMANVAYKLIQSNNELRARTGWEGGVLGLGGRVDMVFAQFSGEADGAASVPDKIKAGHSRLTVTSTFKALPHEWYHELDYVMAREVLTWGHGGTLTQSLQDMARNWGPDLVLHRHGALMDVVEYARTHLQELAPEWKLLRATARQRLDNPYFEDDTEMMAFAFEAQIRKWETTSMGDPSMDEAERQAPLFDAIFQEAAVLDLTSRAKINTGAWNLDADTVRKRIKP